MTDAVIVAATRTPIGKRKGALSTVHPADLSAHVLNALVGKVDLDPAEVDDVVWGCVGQVGEQSFDIARTAVLSAGWPEHVPGVTVDRQCGSSQQAVSFAAGLVGSGMADVVVAGGVESMTRVPMGSSQSLGNPLGERYQERYGSDFPNQGIGAEQIAAQWKLSRTELDEYAIRSHELAAAAQDAGRLATEISPITVDGTEVAEDEGIRRGGTVETLAGLKTPFQEDGVVSAGNASQISDGSAAVLVMSAAAAKARGLKPIARVHTAICVGAPPMPMLTGPIPATEKVLSKSGLSLSDIGVFEVNEAFASVVLAWQKETGADLDKTNPRGGAIALGHPLGASGARLMTTMLAQMQETGARYGLQTMCEGGGQANATILELLD